VPDTGKLIGPQIAAELGDAWHVDPTWPDDYYGVKLAGPDGMRLFVHIPSHSDHKPAGTVKVSRDYPETQYRFEDGDQAEMFARADRGAATIAKEITRKLLTGFADVMVKVRAADERHANARAARDALAARVYAAIGKNPPLPPTRNGEAYERDLRRATHTDVNLHGFADGISGDLWISYEADRVNVKLTGVPPEKMIAALEFIAGNSTDTA
jgi:hypothetical protein